MVRNENFDRFDINNMEVGDKVICHLELGHDYIEYSMIVTTIDKDDFEYDDDGNLYVVAFGEGLTEDDKEFVEYEAGCRIDASNFVCIKV